MANNYYNALFKLPYRINNLENGSRFDEIGFNISNLSDSIGGNVSFSMTGSITSNLIVLKRTEPILFGPYYGNNTNIVSTTEVFDILESDDYKIRYETTSGNINTITGGVIISTENDNFFITCSAFMSYVTLSISSSLSSSDSNGVYDNGDSALYSDRTNSTGIYTKSAITSLTGNTIIDYYIRSGTGGYRLRGFGILNTGSNDELQFTARIQNAGSYPTNIFAIKSVDNTTIQNSDSEIQGTIGPNKTAIFQVEFGKGNYVGYNAKEILTANLIIEHNAENVINPIIIALRNQSSIAESIE